LEFVSWNQELHSFASKWTLVHLAANGSNEPNPVIVFLCCVRSQREKCGMSKNLHAVTQQNNRSFVQVAA